MIKSERERLQVISRSKKVLTLGKTKQYVGETIGQLTILEELQPHVTPNGSKQRIVRCQCSCGNVFVARLEGALKKQKCRKCLDKERRADITGERFGKLVVLSMADDYYSPSGNRLSRCNCLCDCGNTTVVTMSSLVTGKTRSCGCLSNPRGLLKDNEELVKNFDFEKNADIGIDFDALTARTSKKVWWKCNECGYSWYATVASQNDGRKHGCPRCARVQLSQKNAERTGKGKQIAHRINKKRTSQIGSLAECYPDLLDEWDFEKNDSIDPAIVSSKSNLKVWWKCREGHEWRTRIANRTARNSGCPRCRFEAGNSFCEQAVFYYISKAFPEAINGDKHLGVELDIFIPSINTAVEYDGEAWHKTERRITNDIKKNKACSDAGIRIIRIREPKLPKIENCISIIREDTISDHTLNKAISDLLLFLGVKNLQVDIESDGAAILAQYATKKYDNSLAVSFPEIAAEWHPTKNGTLTPDKVDKASRRTVWWMGSCGHEWKMTVAERTRATSESADGKQSKARGCPYCASKKVLFGFNDLETKYPDIAAEWHPIKNGDLKPSEVLAGSNKKVWWLGKCGHEWQASPDKRVYGSGQCPICYKEKRSPAVICVETGIKYDSGAEAAKSFGKNSASSIYRSCRDETKSALGYHWRYKENGFTAEE